MKRNLIFTALLCVTLLVPLSLFGQDFQMNGTTLVKYNGSAANVTIPAGVTAIGAEAFISNSSLTSITIPSSVTSIGNGTFGGCTGLTSVTIPSSVTSVEEGVFEGCRNLRTVLVSRKTTIGNNAFPSTAQITYSD